MSTEGGSIRFERCPRLLDRKRIRQFHLSLLRDVTAPAGFDCLVADDRALRELNRQYLGRDYATDVLAFEGGSETPGQIAISIDRAREQAAERGHSIEDEVAILMLHGALHLTGLDHERDRGKMARAEKSWRTRLGLPEGLIERTGRRR